MRGSIMVMVLLGGCVAERADQPAPTITIKVDRADQAVTTITPDQQDPASQPDVCALAAALPSDDICSLMCDPEAMTSMLLSEGMRPGTCYQLRCVLDSQAVQVGICLPP